MKWTAAGCGAKTAAAGRITGHSHQGRGLISFNPIGILVFGRIKIKSDENKSLGIAGPDTDDSLQRIAVFDFLHDMMIFLGFIQGIFKHGFRLGVNYRFG